MKILQLFADSFVEEISDNLRNEDSSEKLVIVVPLRQLTSRPFIDEKRLFVLESGTVDHVIFFRDYSMYDDPTYTTEDYTPSPDKSHFINNSNWILNNAKIYCRDNEIHWTEFRVQNVVGTTEWGTTSPTVLRWIDQSFSENVIQIGGMGNNACQNADFREVVRQLIRSTESTKYQDQVLNLGGTVISEMALARVFSDAFFEVVGQKLAIQFGAETPHDIIGDNWFATNVLDFRPECDYQTLFRSLIKEKHEHSL